MRRYIASYADLLDMLSYYNLDVVVILITSMKQRGWNGYGRCDN